MTVKELKKNISQRLNCWWLHVFIMVQITIIKCYLISNKGPLLPLRVITIMSKTLLQNVTFCTYSCYNIDTYSFYHIQLLFLVIVCTVLECFNSCVFSEIRSQTFWHFIVSMKFWLKTVIIKWYIGQFGRSTNDLKSEQYKHSNHHFLCLISYCVTTNIPIQQALLKQ